MSPRPRKASDDEIFAAASRRMTASGPGQLTLADIAADVGLTAGALVQRFGSKRELLLALSDHAASGTGEFFTQLRADHPSPLEALRAYAGCFAEMGESPSAVGRSLSYLLRDLEDPAFNSRIMVQARATRAALRKLVVDAVNAGELDRSADPDGLARTVEAVLSGSLVAWAFYRRGTAARWVRDDLEAILRPYLPAAKRKGDRQSSRGGARRAAPAR